MSQTNNVYAQNIPAFKQVINQPATVSDADIAAWIREFYAFLATLNLSAAYRHKELEMFHTNLTLEFSEEVFESPYHLVSYEGLIDILQNEYGYVISSHAKEAIRFADSKEKLVDVMEGIARATAAELEQERRTRQEVAKAREELAKAHEERDWKRDEERDWERDGERDRERDGEHKKRNKKHEDYDETPNKGDEDIDYYTPVLKKLLPLLDKIPDNPEDFGKQLLAGKYCDDDKKIVLYSKVIENDATNAGSVFNAYLAVFMHETFHAFHYYCGEKTDTCEVRSRRDYTATVVKEALADAFTIEYCNRKHIFFADMHNVMTASPIYYPYAAARFLFNDDDPTNPLDENTLYILRLILIFSLYDMTAALWLLSRHHQILIPIIKRQ